MMLQSIVKHAEEKSSSKVDDEIDNDQDEGVAEDDAHHRITPDPAEAKHALEVMTNYAYHINEVKRKHELYLSQLNELKRKQEINPFKFIKSFMKKTNNVLVRVCSKNGNSKIHPK